MSSLELQDNLTWLAPAGTSSHLDNGVRLLRKAGVRIPECSGGGENEAFPRATLPPTAGPSGGFAITSRRRHLRGRTDQPA